MPDLATDVILGVMIILVAGRALYTRDISSSVVHYIIFGLLLSVAWVRLDAPDIALAEAAIGAGLTGALLLDAARALRRGLRSDEASADHDERRGSVAVDP
jgi:energy-converting hydrogenase B subunit D